MAWNHILAILEWIHIYSCSFAGHPDTSTPNHKSSQETQETYTVTQDSSETSLVFSKKRKRQFSIEKNDTPAKSRAKRPRLNENGHLYVKPNLGYTHLITIALRNSPTGIFYYFKGLSIHKWYLIFLPIFRVNICLYFLLERREKFWKIGFSGQGF